MLYKARGEEGMARLGDNGGKRRAVQGMPGAGCRGCRKAGLSLFLV